MPSTLEGQAGFSLGLTVFALPALTFACSRFVLVRALHPCALVPRLDSRSFLRGRLREAFG